MATAAKIRPTEDVIRVANAQSVEKYRDKPYGELAWKMLRRQLEVENASFAS
jgi:hypothetical protein